MAYNMTVDELLTELRYKRDELNDQIDTIERAAGIGPGEVKKFPRPKFIQALPENRSNRSSALRAWSNDPKNRKAMMKKVMAMREANIARKQSRIKVTVPRQNLHWTQKPENRERVRNRMARMTRIRLRANELKD